MLQELTDYINTSPGPRLINKYEAACAVLYYLHQDGLCSVDDLKAKIAQTGDFAVTDVSLYPALKLLEFEGAVEGSWHEAEPRKIRKWASKLSDDQSISFRIFWLNLNA